ncbi:MAG TPA: hypothetical protein PKC76_18685 [Saprospiraceae bacterium]|nr:hypothetical protein [Saprospiraceae bacterium]HMP26162.1 hypothetical protein [Saprospiraceae bacterium]
MKNKLQKFTDFANLLLPHETAYLVDIQQFEDKAKLSILERVHHNAQYIKQFTPYDTSLDKRKYSSLKSWIEERLRAADVDARFEWMSDMERKITTDLITPREEKQLIKAIRDYSCPDFFFTKFYELAASYRHFLLIRMRFAYHKTVDNFLKNNRSRYEESKQVYERIHEATLDIVNQYSTNSAQSLHWENWLTEVFYNEKLDGLNRYLALVRLTFVYLNYRNFEKLREKFDYMDALFQQGVYYSRRILLNYYGNRLLLHTRFQEFERAEYYGYLSVRDRNSDYLFYVNNLCGVLLRQKKHEEALQLMRTAYPEMKTTASFHSKTGFVAFYLKCLNANQQYRNAENYAESFLQAYRKEIFEYRWHLFFSSYLEALLRQEKYAKLIKTVQKYQLLGHERNYRSNANYLPTILWYEAVARYKEMELSREKLTDLLRQSLEAIEGIEAKQSPLRDLLEQMRPCIPGIVNRLQDNLARLQPGNPQ